MTDKQKAYIEYLDWKCKTQGLSIQSTDEELLGRDWKVNYKNFTPKYTGEVIDKMHEALGIPKKEMVKPKRRRK